MKFDFQKRNIHPIKNFKANNSKFEQVLVYIILSLLIILLLGTIIGFIKKAIVSKQTLFNDPSPNQIEKLNKRTGQDLSAFTGLETLRITCKAEETEPLDEQGQTQEIQENTPPILVVSPWFSYKNDDEQFFEELSKKSSVITSIITYYFSSKTKAQILQTNEEIIKEALLKEINAQLRLGKIDQLFFTEFVFFGE